MNIILTGFMGTGKTTIGRILATKLNYNFIDSDALIEERSGKTIADIFAQDGEATFRQWERDIAQELAARQNVVVATGGRLMLDRENAARLGSSGDIFCLTATPDEILQRVLTDEKRVERPLLTVPDPQQRIIELLQERDDLYRQFPQIETSEKTPDQIAQEIINEIKRPIIGLTMYGRGERYIRYGYYDEYYFIPADYVTAVRRAGGVPMLLPPGERNWQRWLDVTDGIIVIGGADVNPEQYGGDAAHPNLTELDSERDESEIRLVQELVEIEQQPFLAICRGMQVLNVAMGGTLYEHIPDTLAEDIHRGDGGKGWAVQPLTATGKMAEVMGSAEVTTYSGHHQAVKQVADGLDVVATAADGIIEALQVSDHPWAFAVQWHPEKSAESDPTQQRLFDELVAQARRCLK